MWFQIINLQNLEEAAETNVPTDLLMTKVDKREVMRRETCHPHPGGGMAGNCKRTVDEDLEAAPTVDGEYELGNFIN